MKIKNTLKQKIVNNILRIVFISFFVITILMAAIWWTINSEAQSKQSHLIQQEINATISLYKSILSQKLSLIANSPVFINYINSGPLTRKDMHIKFLTHISELNSPVIKGMSIDSQHQNIFKSGKSRLPFIRINLCYLNQELNYQYGECGYTWTLYLDRSALLEQLSNINHHLSTCQKNDCIHIDIFHGKKFGIFTIAARSPLSANLTINQPASYLNTVFLLFFIMIFLLGVGLYFSINKIMRSNLTHPINTIIKYLENGRLPNTDKYIDELRFLCNQISEYYKQKDKIEIAKIASQAAHDIRSPLTSLDIVVRKLSNLSDSEKSLIQNATNQIRDIANNLIQKNVKKSYINHSEAKNVLLLPIIEYALSEKNLELSETCSKIELRNDICLNSHTSFIKVIPLELKRILSNLLNNSIESIGKDKGVISISTSFSNNKIFLTIEDNGPGMPSDLIKNVFQEGVSSKETGSGLGLYHAKQNIESWGGAIHIESKPYYSTKITITLPKQPIASWFAEEITLPTPATLIIVDDSESIYDIWQQRLQDDGLTEINTKFFKSAQQFLSWYQTEKTDNSVNVYLIDYEFNGEKLSGLDLIKHISPTSPRFLVTSKAENFSLQEECTKLGIKLIPKCFIPFIKLIKKNNK